VERGARGLPTDTSESELGKTNLVNPSLNASNEDGAHLEDVMTKENLIEIMVQDSNQMLNQNGGYEGAIALRSSHYNLIEEGKSYLEVVREGIKIRDDEALNRFSGNRDVRKGIQLSDHQE
ncbi:hypothetical protein Dimus_000980, partial [Dionaea muscipula]